MASWQATLRVRLPSTAQRADIEEGNKVLLPPSALDELSMRAIAFPMIFEIFNPENRKLRTYGSVLEFTAAHGEVVMPLWMIEKLFLVEGDRVTLHTVRLPKATYVKLQPLKYEFTELSNPKAALETALSHHYCSLTKGETISVRHLGKVYQLNVLETQPGDAVSIIGVEVNVDFAPPVESRESVYQPLRLGEEGAITGSVEADAYRYYALDILPAIPQADEQLHKSDLQFSLTLTRGDADMFISQKVHRPTVDNHVWTNLSSGVPEKTLVIRHDDPRRTIPGTFYIGVRGFRGQANYSLKCIAVTELPAVSTAAAADHTVGHAATAALEGARQCEVCQQWVPPASFERHTAFCRRNNWRCLQCGGVLRVVDKEAHRHCAECGELIASSTSHVHCPKCRHVMTAEELSKHEELVHTPMLCPQCGKVRLELEELQLHKEYECDARTTVCEWCSDMVPLVDLETHRERCGAETIKCDECKQYVMKRDLVDHFAHRHAEMEPAASHSALARSREKARRRTSR